MNYHRNNLIHIMLVLFAGIIPALVFAFDDTNHRGSTTDVAGSDKQLDILQAEWSEPLYPEESDLFDLRLLEVKTLYADAIIADITGDTLDAAYLFEQLFEALSELKDISIKDEFQYLEFNRMLTAAINYYENDAGAIDKVETGLSVAILRDKLNEYIYNQSLEDLEYVEESVEIIPGHIPITYNRKVANIIKFYQSKGKKSVQHWLDRMDRYKAIVLPILEEEGVPLELFYLAMIESGLRPDAYSHKYAAGLWQFVKSTGKVYGLNKTWWVDERNDFEKSTHAAARYLKDLYAIFDDWYLAFAAYNSGEGGVNRAIRRDQTKDYWKLHSLPRETRNYVPNIMAALFMANDPGKYGIRVNPQPNMEWNVIEINKTVRLELISKCSGVDIKTLQDYNPELRQGVIPPLEENETYSFRMPVTASNQFDSLFALIEVEKSEELVLQDHKVKRGESLWVIAKKYGVRIQDIVVINKLQNSRYIQNGQILKIPVSGYAAIRKETTSSQKIYYTVKYGDTLSGIAEKHRTSVKKMKRWNGLRSDFIRNGQKLIIWKK